MADYDFKETVKAGNPLRITNPELIPAKRYYDEDFYQLECERLWPHVWQMACRLEQISEVGDWIEYSNLGKSVIVVRTKDGVKAFHNHCRHRGVPIAGGKGNEHGNCRTSGFICPFHGWRWNMEGESTFVYGKHLFSQELLDKGELALRSCRVELALGCAFINFDDDAPSLRESLGPVVERLEAHGADKVRAEWWFATVLPANWKIAMEAFMEGYHVMKTHPQLQRAVPALYNQRYGNETGGIGQPVDPQQGVRDNISSQMKSLELLNSGMAGMVQPKEVAIARQLADAELPDDPAQAVPIWYGMVQDAISKQLRANGEDVPDLNAVAVSDPVEAVEFLFPHFFLLPFFTSMSSYRIRPLGPESCMFEIWSLTHFAEGEEPEPPMEPTVLPYDSQDFPMIPRQDYSNIPIQQKGMHSQGFESLRLGKNIEGLISNYQRLIDGYIAGVSPEKLAEANQKLGGNFDGPILNLGF
jgi:phenylpropionate dioxygenase-like ring-hydroxylating dioxygenase large terminal subunit